MRKLWMIIAATLFCFCAGRADQKSPLSGLKPWEVPYLPPEASDSIGAVDTLFLDLQKGTGAGEWVLHFSVCNDESLFALSFPIRFDSTMKVDSVSLVGTRTDFFQTKMLNKKPPVPHTVTVGLFSALSPEAPSMPPGRGLVMKMYFKAPPSRPISVRSVAPIMMPPTLEFVMRRGLAIHPAVVRVGDAGPTAEEKPAPTAKPVRKNKKS